MPAVSVRVPWRVEPTAAEMPVQVAVTVTGLLLMGIVGVPELELLPELVLLDELELLELLTDILEHGWPARVILAIPTLLIGPGFITWSVRVFVEMLYWALTICTLAAPVVLARNVVYIYHPTATAITIIIANSIASSIEVRPFISSKNVL